MHPNKFPIMSATVRHLRITRRRIGYAWTTLPPWTQDGLTACVIALPLWMLLAAVLLVL